MGIFDGVAGGQGGLTKDDAAYQQQVRRMEMEMEKQKYIEKEKRYRQAMNMAQTSMLGQQQFAHQGLGGVQAPKARTPIPRFNPNDSEAFQIPMSQLITMWRLKHGEEWFDGQQIRKEDFYDAAFERLNRAQLFESFEGWYRLKEDA